LAQVFLSSFKRSDIVRLFAVEHSYHNGNGSHGEVGFSGEHTLLDGQR